MYRVELLIKFSSNRLVVNVSLFQCSRHTVEHVACRQGPFPVQFWHWSQIEYNMQLCLGGLKDVDR